ncbi:O-antigen ligase family protein [Patulibacter sp. SYSU D01012]|uniref:O-antigen ligase family protein n=1 Tax=Patulibacter sp. SYSU D01012 TaxID=2817381 RepID=UPI001B30194C|nr:O-antigen ligase family protein [Patulibacter sp. SYSU D01012]
MPTAVATSARPEVLDRLARLTSPVAAFLAGAAPVVLLGFSRGGYPVEVVAGYGVALWWLLLVGFLTDALPRPRPTTAGWAALAAVTGLALWGGLSLTRSDDPERGLTEVVRLIVAGGTLLLGMSAVRAGQARALAGGVLAGLTTVVGAAALSRLQPDLFPQATETARFLETARQRVSWPLNYWNAIAASGAMGLPLAVSLAARARHAWTSAVAVACIPTLAVGTIFTLSRTGIAASVVGLLLCVLCVAPRPVVLRTMLAPGIAAAAVLLIATRSDALTDVVGGQAQTDAGRSALVVLLVATLGAALVQAGWTSADQAHWTPVMRRPRRTVTATAVAVVAVVAVVIGAALGGGPVERAWERFKSPDVTTVASQRDSSERLGSISGNGRYQIWTRAIAAVEHAPLRGVGIGGWESWWNRDRTTGFVRNAHSEPLEIAAETGIPGLLLLAVLLGAPLAGAGRQVARPARRQRTGVLVLPSFVAFLLALSVDWNWQIGAVMVAGMTLAAAAIGSRADRTTRRAPRGRRIATTVAVSAVSVAAIATLATALVAPQAVDASRQAASRGALGVAAAEAARGEAAAPFAASPALQRALVLERTGSLDDAAAAARTAAARAPRDWRPWFVLARIETARDRPTAAVEAFRRARRLNPDSSLLRP